MGAGFTLLIPYEQLLLLVMALFMFVGATRGWYREFISTIVLVALAAILIQPELATPIIRYIAGFLRVLLAFVRSGFSLDLSKLAKVASDLELPFDANNPYMFLILMLVGSVLLSYGTTGGKKQVTAVSHVLGGLLVLLNGFLIVSLFKEYVVGYLQRTSHGLWAAGPPSAISVAVQGVPLNGLLGGSAGTVVFILLGLMVAVPLIGIATGRPIGKR